MSSRHPRPRWAFVRTASWLIVAAVLFPTQGVEAGADERACSGLCMLSSKLIVVPGSGEITERLELFNGGGQPSRLALGLGPLVPADAKKTVLAKVQIKPPARPEIQAQGRVDATLEITEFHQETEIMVDLFNGPSRIAALRIVRAPFAVTLDKETHGQTPIVFARNSSTTVLIRNDADVPINVAWRITIEGVPYCGHAPESDETLNLRQRLWRLIDQIWAVAAGPLCRDDYEAIYKDWRRASIAPYAKYGLDVNPPAQWYPRDFSGVFKDEVQDATLTLAWLPPGFDKAKYTPRKDIPFKAQLKYYTPLKQNFWSTLVIGIALLLGGVGSLTARNWVPNQLRKRDLKEKLAGLSRAASGLSSHIESGLRVLVRTESRRLFELLDSRPTLSPDMASLFSQCESGVTVLSRRIAQLQVVDSLLDRLTGMQSVGLPPSWLEYVESLSHKACHLLRHVQPLELDFQAAQTLIAEASGLLDGLAASDEKFGGTLAKRWGGLREDFRSINVTVDSAAAGPNSEISSGVVKRVRDALPGPFSVLREDRFGDLATIPVDSYAWLDLNLSTLAMLRDYIRLYEASTSSAFRTRLEAEEPAFLAALSYHSREQLGSARSLLRQMQEGVFEDDVALAIARGQCSIEMDPPVAKVWQSVRLSVRFHRAALNGSAAVERFLCLWSFRPSATGDDAKSMATSPIVGDDESLERGWVVSHYFPGTREEVAVCFEDAHGRRLCAVPDDSSSRCVELEEERSATVEPSFAPAVPASLSRSVIAQRDVVSGARDRLFLELVGLAIVLLIALLGLITGAREQVLKLDIVPGLIGVFLLGFGADAIKGLLTQRPGAQ